METIVFGNATLDILCRTVDEVPRYDSIAFEQVIVTPGGCGSNVAIGLQSSGIPTALVASIGADDAGDLAQRYWKRVGIDLRYVRTVSDRPTGTSVGLIDSSCQPRFIHTSGANALLTCDAMDSADMVANGARALHIGGFFVLPGLLDGRLPEALSHARQRGMLLSLDVVRSPRMKDPSMLWPCMPFLDVFLCNNEEASRLSGESEPPDAAKALHARGSRVVIVKLGAAGCWLETKDFSGRIPGQPADVVDTTGAGDAFAAGLIAALLRGKDLTDACQDANAAGAIMVSRMGAISGWLAQTSSNAA
jgi:sugar/nucleoside kinase (ribokinase family)